MKAHELRKRIPPTQGQLGYENFDVVILTPDGYYWNVSDAYIDEDAEGDTVFLITMKDEAE